MPIPRVPFFRDENIDGIEVEGSASSVGGVLANKKGEVQALWASFVNLGSKDQDRELFGISSYYLKQALVHHAKDDIRILGAVLGHMPLADARRYGLSDTDSAGLSEIDSKRRVLYVERVSVSEPANDSLRGERFSAGADSGRRASPSDWGSSSSRVLSPAKSDRPFHRERAGVLGGT